MVEVFKTNVIQLCDAEKMLQTIKNKFCHYLVNFDLEDCDKILRVECEGAPDYEFLEHLFLSSGFSLEVLTN